MLLEKKSENTIVSRRVIYALAAAAGGVSNIIMDKKMLSFVKTSRQRYMAHLEENRQVENEK